MIQETKVCSICNEVKLADKFSKDKRRKDGLASECKDCKNIRTKEYNRTIPGLITKIYSAQRSNSKIRGMNTPTYSNLEFTSWIINQPNFNELYEKWVDSGYKKMLRPSVDRLDDYMPYTMSNIQLMTWQENKNKYYKDTKAGINKKTAISVVSYNKNTEETTEYYSAREASRRTGVNASGIIQCCKGKIKTAGGFNWEYKEINK